ncbi:MAG: FAD-dependent oxidoreductase [Sphingobium sp.]|nr:FAD-dependent oxidoreductase [Sphingobium sp.]
MSGVVIVGAGQAGLQLAASLRELGYGGSIRLIGDEPHAPYQRPPLSKAYLAGTAPDMMLFMQEPNWFAQHEIDFLPDETVVSVNRELRQVDLRSGAFLDYEHLVFATGTRNRHLPCVEGAIEGVLSLRTLDDARQLQAALQKADRIVIVGAGFLGLEAATIAAAAGRHVRVIEAGPRVLGRVASEPVSTIVRQCHEEAGVVFDFNESVVAVHGNVGRVEALELQSGERVPADLVLISIGVVPNAELAAAAGLEVHNGIVVDRQMRTEDPCISAIGDCAAFPFMADRDRMVRLESVQNAVDQARCLAERIMGRGRDYDAVPLFWSDQAGLRLQMAGLTKGGETAVIRGDPASRAFSVFCYDGDRLVAVESVSRLPDHMQARKLLQARISPTSQQAADSGFDLKTLISVRAAA